MPHSTCTPCGWAPHFHKSLGLHLTRERERKKDRKKTFAAAASREHKAWRILHHALILQTLLGGYTWHIHPPINVLHKDTSIKHPTTCSKSQYGRGATQSQLAAHSWGRKTGGNPSTKLARNEGVKLNKKDTFSKTRVREARACKIYTRDRAEDLRSRLDSKFVRPVKRSTAKSVTMKHGHITLPRPIVCCVSMIRAWP